MSIDRLPATVAAPGRVGQGTAIEQSRAVAEVQAAIVVAQQCPRNIQSAIADMRDACGRKALAERAFYAFPRAGKTVSGESIHLARELARCWGNIQYGIAELRRDDELGQSEMQAFAWDIQSNARTSHIFIVPHKRDTTKGATKLTDMREIYENNANNGARRVREAIFGVLPSWFVDEASERCRKTLEDGGGVPLAQRIANAIAAFEGLGVTVDQIEQKLARPSGKWTDFDVAQLTVTYQSLRRGELTRDEAFPAPQVTAAEIQAAVAEEPKPVKKAAKRAAPPEPEPELGEPEDWPAVPEIPSAS
jgi:hypothetical protein